MKPIRGGFPAAAAFLGAMAVSAYSGLAAGDAGGGSDWRQVAGGIYSEDAEEKAAAVAALRVIPRIADTLRAELDGPDRSLAYDVAATLGRRDLVPDLLTRLPSDQEGYLTAAVVELIDDSVREPVAAAFSKRLEDPATPFQVRVVLLEGLLHAKAPVRGSRLAALLKDQSPDIRLLAYRHAVAAGDAATLRAGLKESIYQIRLFAAHSLSGKFPRDRSWVRDCAADADPRVREACK